MRSWSGWIRVSLAAVGMLTAVACGSSASPAPSTAPAQSPAPSRSAESPSAAAKPAASPDWKAQWDQTVAAAKTEGKVAVLGYTGDLHRDAAMAFQKSFPDIKVEYLGMAGSDMGPKLLAERNGGQFLWDAYFGGSSTGLTVFRPNGVMDPLKPILMLPEVVDDSKWTGGTQNAWMDKEKQFIFAYEAALLHTISVRRDLVPESELSTLDQLLDPKWKGKIVARNLKVNGAQSSCTSLLYKVKGEEWIRKLYAQEIVQFDDERAVVEAVVRGRYPIMVCVDPGTLQPFKADGLAKDLKPLDPNSEGGVGLNNGVGNAILINKAPHPNAAKVFLNWLLSVDGQKAWVESTKAVSRRTDVSGGDPDLRPAPNRKYIEINAEENLSNKTNAQNIAKEVFK